MKPWYDDGQARFYLGDCREVMRELEPESVQTVVCSPPYWSLRDYGVEPTVWGGHICGDYNAARDWPRCGGGCCCRGEHEWGATVEQQRGGAYSGKTRWQHIADEANDQGVPVRTISPESWGLTDGHPKVASGQFCQRCGAWLGALGLEPTPDLFVAHIVEVFREVRRVLRKDGALWLNVGDSYAGSYGAHARGNHTGDDRSFRLPVPVGNFEAAPISTLNGHENGLRLSGRQRFPNMGIKAKDLIGIPWMLAFALRADGWWLRQDIIWSKPNPMPESVRDRCTKAHEYLFLLTKSERYYSNMAAVRERSTGLERYQIEARSARVADGNKSMPTDMVNGIRPRSWKGSEFDDGKNAIVHPDVGKKRSGNKERKPASARGVPIDTGGSTNGAGDGSVPWEGDSRNKRSVWNIPTHPSSHGVCSVCKEVWLRLAPTQHCGQKTVGHFATFPPALVEQCVLMSTREGDVVLDPFVGSGTTAEEVRRLGRRGVYIDLNEDFLRMAVERLGEQLSLSATGGAS